MLRGCVNLCSLSKTVNGPVPSLGPHPHDYTGGHMRSDIPTLRPPIPAQARYTQAIRTYPQCATQQHHTIVKCAYERRQTASCRTQQHHTIAQCAYARRQAVIHQHQTMALRAHAHNQEAWCTTACSRDPASRTLTAILINLVTHGY
jgi:hypothetical protein